MGEPMCANEAGQELLCRLPSNSNASGTPAARLVPASTSICSQGSPTRGHTTSPFARAAGLITSAQPPANFGSVVYVQAPWASVLALTHMLLLPYPYEFTSMILLHGSIHHACYPEAININSFRNMTFTLCGEIK